MLKSKEARGRGYFLSEIDLNLFFEKRFSSVEEMEEAVYDANLTLEMLKLDYLLHSEGKEKFTVSEGSAVNRYFDSAEFDEAPIRAYYALVYLQRYESKFNLQESLPEVWGELMAIWDRLMSGDEKLDVEKALTHVQTLVVDKLILNDDAPYNCKMEMIRVLFFDQEPDFSVE